MQKLHLVGFTPEFDGLIFSTRKGAKSGGFVVPLDAGLMKQIAEADRLRDGAAMPERNGRLGSPRLVRPESALSPREMQDRIRAGWSIEEVAAEAGVDLDWVARFASPVLAEMERILDRARATTFQRPRVGLSGLPLGAAVRRNVAERSVRIEDDGADDGWSAFQLDEVHWVVRFAYRSRGREQQAEWLYEADTDEISSRNRLGSQLAYVARGRRRAVPPAAPARRPSTGKAAPAKSAPARRAAPARSAAKRATPARATKATGRSNGKAAAPAKRAAAPRGKATVAKRATGSRPAKRAKLPAPVPPRQPPGISPPRPPLIRPLPLPVAPSSPMTGPVAGHRPAGVPPQFAPGVPSFPSRPGPAPVTPVARAPRPPMPEAGEVEGVDGGGQDWSRPSAATAPSQDGPDAPATPEPGAVSFDAERGIAHIDSRRNASFVGASPAGRVPGAPSEARSEPPPAARRRTEQLRAR